MSVESARLLKDLQAELKPLVDDMRARCDEHPEVDAVVRAEWDEAATRGRTSRSYTVWRDDHLTNVAVAWLLALVFVRFCEDNDLVSPPLLGGSADRRDVARGHRTLYFQQHPGDGDREWLLEVFHRSRRLPGLSDVLGAHSPLWSVGPTADGARRLIEFWEKADPETGEVRHDFSDAQLDTRFLGDLYQDLSETAKKQYALLQTPIFVEEFILDRTLDPAIAEFGLDEVSLIDPTCGSGHFLLGAFARLSELLADRHAGEAPAVIAQRALHAIAGVDLNPAAAAIARFRLLVAALKVCGATKLADLPAFELNVAVGDSLLHGRIPGQTLDFAAGDMSSIYQHAYSSEDVEQAKRILFRRYSAVVGNPPYITVKDAAMKKAYRNMFKSCSGLWVLSVPFFERFFDLAVTGSASGQSGFVGMITANSFMKREFGRTLVEEIIPNLEITHLIDTQHAFIPGHNSTAIILGRSRFPATDTLRAVLGTRGEPTRPNNPATGRVWSSITHLVDLPGSENEFVSVADIARSTLARHPWSIGGGGAAHLKESLDHDRSSLFESIDHIGYTGQTNADDVFIASADVIRRFVGSLNVSPTLVTGEKVRDWSVDRSDHVFTPYEDGSLLAIEAIPGWHRRLWPFREVLWSRATFNGSTYKQAGRPWYEWHLIRLGRLLNPLSITFPNVTTSNHFVLDEAGALFNSHAPVVKLHSAESQLHFPLVGLLNSSTVCFWLHQVCQNKGRPGINAAGADEPYEQRYEIDAAKLRQLPLPSTPISALYGQRINLLSREVALASPSHTASRTVPMRDESSAAHRTTLELTQRMIAAQEELDWYVYGLYDLLGGENFTFPLDEVPPIALGERAFEIVMARQIEAGELETTWFVRHGSTPITEIPAHWPDAYREVVSRRIDKIASDRDIALIERPECKRRWAAESWDSQVERALRGWLLDRLEAPGFWAAQQLSLIHI